MGMSNSKGGGSQSGTSSSTGNSLSNSSFISSNTNPYSNTMFHQGESIFNSLMPTLNAYEQSLNNALTSGSLSGVGIPMAQAAIAQARGASSATQQGTENFLARMGGANSPFAASVLGSEAMQGNEAVAQAPVGIYQSLLGQIPGFLQGMTGTAAGQEQGAASLVGNQTGAQSSSNWYQQHGASQGNNSFSGSGFNMNFGDLANAGAALFGF